MHSGLLLYRTVVPDVKCSSTSVHMTEVVMTDVMSVNAFFDWLLSAERESEANMIV